MYIKNALYFLMDKSHPLCTPMVVRSLDVNKDPFRLQEKDEEILGPKVPYFSAIEALMYLVMFKCFQIRTNNGYANANYLSDPYNGKSQARYLFTSGGTAISWRSVKQIILAISSNHAEILALHKASRECVWLRSMIQHIRETCDLSSEKMTLIVIYEDNVACIAQLKD
uniref:Retrovirus-related Pol polyprotein from transposon TNT 1-94 n=1 Tax=Cajanus cajan TaxID=3821 RepID=A0A151RHB8_CAJCA|nr:Retrovirus-related Pol polyprotein from transposon TNT 1-94 [Cajanus cajan]